MGRTFLLAGRTDEALPSLERAARSCRVFELPVEHTRAQLWLGTAREAKGDKEGACAAYRAVRDALAGAGVTINGLCVLHEEPDLVASFEREVIGGPGAFAQTCGSYKDFAEAMRRKLLREVTDKAIA